MHCALVEHCVEPKTYKTDWIAIAVFDAAVFKCVGTSVVVEDDFTGIFCVYYGFYLKMNIKKIIYLNCGERYEDMGVIAKIKA